MRIKDMTHRQRKELEISLNDDIMTIDLFSEEPFIQFMDGTVIYIDEVER